MGMVCAGVLFNYKSTNIHFMSGLQKSLERTDLYPLPPQQLIHYSNRLLAVFPPLKMPTTFYYRETQYLLFYLLLLTALTLGKQLFKILHMGRNPRNVFNQTSVNENRSFEMKDYKQNSTRKWLPLDN